MFVFIRRSAILGMVVGAATMASAQTPTNKGLLFNGTTDHIQTTTVSATHLINGYTVEAWAYPTETTTTARRIVSNQSNDAPLGSRGWGLGSRNMNWRFTTYGIKDFDTAAGTLDVNQWTHIAVTLGTTNTATFYKNGQFLASSYTGAAPLEPKLSTSTLNIGRNPIRTEYWKGRIDEIRIWNYVRTPAEIAADMYKQLDGTEPGLIAYYPFSEGTGNTTLDVSPNAGDGTLFGPTWVVGSPTGPPTSAGKEYMLYE